MTHHSGRRRLHSKGLALGIGAVLTVAAAGCGGGSGGGTSSSGAGPSGLTHVSLVQAGQYTAGAPYYVAQELGYFKDEGLDVKIVTVQGSSALMSAVSSGSAPFGQPTGVSLLAAVTAGGTNLVAVSQFSLGLQGIEFVVKKDVAEQRHITKGESWEDTLRAVKGLTVGVLATASTSGQELTGLIHQLGLPKDWVNVIGIQPAGAVQALAGGTIQAFFEPDPAPQAAVAQGVGVLTFTASDPPPFGEMSGVDLVTTPQYAKAHPDVVKRMVAAITRGQKALLNKDQKAFTALHDKYFPNTDPEQLKEAAIAGLQPTGKMELQTWQKTAQAAYTMGLIPKKLSDDDLKKLFTNAYV